MTLSWHIRVNLTVTRSWLPAYWALNELCLLLKPVTLLQLVLLMTGCAVSPSQTGILDYNERAETQVDDGVRVSAVVLSPLETESTFASPLANKGIQPVWVEIDNQEEKEFTLMLTSLGPDYFSPSEVAWRFRGQREMSFEDLMDLFLEKHLPVIIPPRSTVSGYVYTNLDPGAKAFAVELVGEHSMRSFEFVQVVPGFEADFMRVDFHQLYEPGMMQDLDLGGLREYLEELPCCVLGGDRETPGDPLNLVLVGDGRHVLATLVRNGWDLTETMRRDTAWQTIASSVFGSHYRTSPVSPLYLFGRSQDFALQKARHNVNVRNHLRLWLAPVTLEGQNVWVGQISRDIGVKLTSKTIVTHKIDPVVDEARLYITLDLAASVRWTFLFMHEPSWENPSESFRSIQALLKDRPFTWFAGHLHYYDYDNLDGREYITMGPAGASWHHDGPGNVDHITWVTMTEAGPEIANIALKGTFDRKGLDPDLFGAYDRKGAE